MNVCYHLTMTIDVIVQILREQEIIIDTIFKL